MISCTLPSARVGRLPNERLPRPVFTENSTGLKPIGAPLESRKVAITATGGSVACSFLVERVNSPPTLKKPAYVETRAFAGGAASSGAAARVASANETVFHSAVIAVTLIGLGRTGAAALAVTPQNTKAANVNIGNTIPGFHHLAGVAATGSGSAISGSCSRVSQIDTIGNTLAINV